MAMYLIQHQHTLETCPTRNLDMVRALRAHVTAENAERMGLKLLADWVYEPEHSVVLVVETDDPAKAEAFAAPFKMNGEVTVRGGQTCEEVAKVCLGE
jgi:uncharacterized protein with GYD domain